MNSSPEIADRDVEHAAAVVGRGPSRLGDEARERMLSVQGEPLFIADWMQAVFIHYEVDPAALQREIPFSLDLREGRAYVSLVAFTMRNMRPRLGGKAGALLFKPIGTHGFLNVRAYVRNHDEPGIFFLAEWLSNPLSVHLGPPIFGLPYRHGRLSYRHEHAQGELGGVVEDVKNGSRLEYMAEATQEPFVPCDAGSLDEFLMERYTAFTFLEKRRNARMALLPSLKRFFRIWHPPWPQMPIDLRVVDDSLLTASWPWFADARMVGANYSTGVENVWMGRPHRIRAV